MPHSYNLRSKRAAAIERARMDLAWFHGRVAELSFELDGVMFERAGAITRWLRETDPYKRGEIADEFVKLDKKSRSLEREVGAWRSVAITAERHLKSL